MTDNIDLVGGGVTAPLRTRVPWMTGMVESGCLLILRFLWLGFPLAGA